MKILILGANGYIGNALHGHLENKGHEVLGVDNDIRHSLVDLVGGKSLCNVNDREYACIDICEYNALLGYIKLHTPDTIVHLAEQPSAPYSMLGPEECAFTQHNNIIGTLNVLWAIKEVNPKIHLIKLGTAGEYPDWLYPNMTIPESPRITVNYQNKYWTIPTPRFGGSLYHMSKLHDSNNIDYLCKIWGLNVTDINQAPVYGHIEGTRFDYDSVFGTVVNRFAVQSVSGEPLTLYGKGGQVRGFIHLKDSIEAIRLIIEDRPEGFTIVNQMAEQLKLRDVADMFVRETGCKVKNIKNPRSEMEEHEFSYTHQILKELGLEPSLLQDNIRELVEFTTKHKDNINKDLFKPTTTWKK